MIWLLAMQQQLPDDPDENPEKTNRRTHHLPVQRSVRRYGLDPKGNRVEPAKDFLSLQGAGCYPGKFSAPQRRGSPVEEGSIRGVVGRPW
jgi:hypothetical protein